MRGRAQFVFDFEAPLKTVGGDKGFAVEILVRAVGLLASLQRQLSGQPAFAG